MKLRQYVRANMHVWADMGTKRKNAKNTLGMAHGAEFFDEFDLTYGLMMPEIVGLMYHLQRYGVR